MGSIIHIGGIFNMKSIKTLIAILVVVIVVLILNVFLYITSTLERPVFLNHYYEKEISDNSIFKFYYITNKSDENIVTHITFPEIIGMDIRCVVKDTKAHGVYGHYKLNVVSMGFEENESAYIPETKVTTAKVFFSDGRIIPTNIGKIVLSKEMEQEIPFLTLSTTSSSNHSSSVTYKALEKMLLSEVKSDLDFEVEDHLYINMDKSNEVSLPYTISKGDSITFESNFKVSEEDMEKYNAYSIVKKFYFETPDGKQYIHSLYHLDYKPEFNKKDIYSFLKMKGAI